MSQKLTVHLLKQQIGSLRIKSALVFLGIEADRVYKFPVVRNGNRSVPAGSNRDARTAFRKKLPDFWEKDPYELRTLLSDAKDGYRKMAMVCHPDMEGGSEEIMKEVNKVWTFVEKLFERKGITLND